MYTCNSIYTIKERNNNTTYSIKLYNNSLGKAILEV